MIYIKKYNALSMQDANAYRYEQPVYDMLKNCSQDEYNDMIDMLIDRTRENGMLLRKCTSEIMVYAMQREDLTVLINDDLFSQEALRISLACQHYDIEYEIEVTS